MSTTTPRPTRDERRRAARAQRQAAERAAADRVRRTRRMWQLGGVLAVAAVLVVAAIAVSSSGGQATRPAGASVADAGSVSRMLAGIPQRGNELGAAGAPVTLVEFADLKCPICRDYSLNVQPTLVQRYVRAGKLKIQFRAQHFVGEQINPGDSLAAARFAEAAARQNRLWNFAGLFYANQQDESTRYVSDAYLRKLGAAIPGLAVDRALADRSSSAVTAELQGASNEFTARGFTGTPSFLVGRTGGTLAPLDYGQLSPAAFTGPIDRLLAQ